ncbi:MOSC domain-containing protein [bacterium]|nr:MOSC domain-containing protein [bacterium]MBU1653189.1 MOSC domain-containing protein [bacterium]MBU1882281.1 MOSC domain-containing protein [bacterium]
MKTATVFRLSISANKGEKKRNVSKVTFDEKLGIIGDAHGTSERQISLLPIESFGKLQAPDLVINPGDFAENVTTIDLDFSKISIGTRLQLGSEAQIEIMQIGKECHENCIIREKVGDCIMPREGVFGRVLRSGTVRVGENITIL